MTLRGRSWRDLRRIDMRALARRPVVVAFLVLGAFAVVQAIAEPDPLDLLLVALVALLGLAVIRERRWTAGIESARRGEAESFARILRGLSRSVSPDAIVEAIAEELGAGAGADHVAVVRRRPETRNLEAVLTPTRSGIPTSRTTLPLRELEDPVAEPGLRELSTAASRARRLTPVPIVPDLDGDPQLVPLGLARPGGAGREPFEVRRAAGGSEAGTWPRRPPLATPVREGAEQRIADRIALRLGDSYGLRNLMAAPLRVNGRVEGAIVLSRRAGSPWPGHARRLLEAAAVEASAALARAYTLRDAEARATTDALTDLPNRRYFDEYLGLLSRRRRTQDRVGILMVDIDLFKVLNDTYGHAVGDQVLREVARAIAGAVRGDDLPARYGGEEFVVLLRNPSVSVAVEVGERIRRAVGALDLDRFGASGVSVSVGVAVAETPEAPLDEVIAQADEALYRAKREGRDRVVAA